MKREFSKIESPSFDGSFVSPFKAARLQHERNRTKSFNDPVHEEIPMEGVCLRIIDTPQFQRLRHLKQLGVCDYVFPGATHSRFIHSLGVAHLAEKQVRKLMHAQPELQLTEQDAICVKIAGLCHDLGHGPFSHVFDGVFMKSMYPHGIPIEGLPRNRWKKWEHEEGSVKMFKHLIQANGIRLHEFGLNERDVQFIEETIRGTPEETRNGRGRDKAYLYDIVNNTRSGLDVDKLDYLARDMRMANVEFKSDFKRSVPTLTRLGLG
jgi:HD superfamily phosphohydrolase